MKSRILILSTTVALLSSIAVSAQTNPLKVMKGVITDSRSGKPIQGGGRLFVHSGAKTEPVAISKINPSTGAYQVVLPPATDYRFVVHAARYLPAEKSVRTPGGNNYEEVVVATFSVEPIPVGKVLFTGRGFDASKSEVKVGNELTKAIAFLKQSQAALVTVSITPDGPSPRPVKAAPKPKAKSKSKKGKKAAVVVEEEPSATPIVVPTYDEQLKALTAARQAAFRALMQKEGISLTRIKWDVPSNAADLRATSTRRDNLVITIRGVDVGEEEDDD